MSGLFSVLNELRVVVAPVLAQVEAGPLPAAGPWRPPEWNQPALTALTVPGTPAVAGTGGAAVESTLTDSLGQTLPGAPAYGGTAGTPGTPTQVFIFDAVLRVEHQRVLRRTEHPIQASASSPFSSITDHAYLLPARVTLDIGMSDAMASYTPNAWGAGDTKSVNAYQQLVALQAARTLLTLTTRLATYPNMIVESLSAPDDAKTRHGLRAQVVLSQVALADVTGVQSTLSFDPNALSARPQTTDQTPTGFVQSLPVSSALTNQNNVTGTAALQNVVPNGVNIPGAGAWSSVSVSRLKGVFA